MVIGMKQIKQIMQLKQITLSKVKTDKNRGKRAALLCMASLLVLTSLLSGCGLGAKQAAKVSNTRGAQLALTTDVGSIDDRSFNQGSWEGLLRYAEETGKTRKYYQPTEKSDEAFRTVIDLAVKGDAEVVVCPGYLYEVPVYSAQQKYPDTHFILLDGTPRNADTMEAVVGQKTISIYFAEEQAGFLAGYAAVKEGYRSLGFMGGIAVPAVIRFGYGYLQGIDYAAAELGLEKGSVKVKYTYVGNFEASPENMAKAASWYNDGVEVIFSCGGPVGNSVMKAAETANKKVIGVDVDQSAESPTVITSATKNLQKAVYDVMQDIEAGTFTGGQSFIMTAKEDGVRLPMETSRFEHFTQENYQEIYDKIAEGSITIGNDTLGESADMVPVTLIDVAVIR